MSLASSHFRNVRYGIFALAVFALAMAPQPAEAQTVFAWFAKFNCGYYQGSVPLLNDPNPSPIYEEFKPGNYATTINLVNLSTQAQNIFIYVLKTNQFSTGTRHLLGQLTVPGILDPNSLGPNFRIGCPTIAAVISATSPAPLPPGAPIEGHLFLLPAAGGKNFQVDAFYGFESQNESSTGGLGLGGSVDEERIEAVEIEIAAAEALMEVARGKEAVVKLPR